MHYLVSGGKHLDSAFIGRENPAWAVAREEHARVRVPGRGGEDEREEQARDALLLGEHGLLLLLGVLDVERAGEHLDELDEKRRGSGGGQGLRGRRGRGRLVDPHLPRAQQDLGADHGQY